MKLLSGKEISQRIKDELKEEVSLLPSIPGLATVLVGDDPASHVYVGSKIKACEYTGISSHHHQLPANISQNDLLNIIDTLNTDKSIHGILVQLPIPDHLNESEILNAIDPRKDVDGFHPTNMGLLLGNKGELDPTLLLPCTPKGIMTMLKETGIPLSGKNAVVIGRSNLVGKPISLLLTYANATTTVCHSRTSNLAQITKNADIIVAAVGKPKMITADMVKDGAIVIDVGINRTNEGLVGDVDFDAIKDKASWITPVPGGVGPMTIASLLQNTLTAYKNSIKR